MKKTIKQRNLEFLQSNGWSINHNSRTSKYVELIKPGVDYSYFLGKSGAVRRGRNVSSTISVRLKLVDANHVKSSGSEVVAEVNLLGV